MEKSYYEKKADEEAHWKQQENEWLENLKTTPLYTELQAEFDGKSLETYLPHMAQMRTRYLRYGPQALEEIREKKIKFKTDATHFLLELHEKKFYDTVVGWMIGDVHLEGIYTLRQLTFGKVPNFSCPFIGPVRPDEIEFLRYLLKDEDYIRSGEFPKFDGRIPDTGDLDDWQKERTASKEFPKYYPVFFRKYDQYFNQVHRLHAPFLRYEKYQNYVELALKDRKSDLPPTEPDPEDGKPYYLDYDETKKVTAEWFQRFESAKVQTWFRAHEKYVGRESVYDSSQFYEVMDALNESFVKPYPDPNLPWNEALKVEGRRIWFRNIVGALDEAYSDYLEKMKKGEFILKEKPGAMVEPWVGMKEINENEKRLIFEGQRILGEPENLNYYTV